MNALEVIILNFEEIRRRSIKLWTGIPEDCFHWKPDKTAMTCLEMVRHVLEGEHLYHIIINTRGNLSDYKSPWDSRPYIKLQDELEFCKTYRAQFIDFIKTLSETDLQSIEIIRADKGQRRLLGDYLNRIAYHESVHTGQMLSYLRQLQIERPNIWD
ncbi:MAG: DinB family protein [Chitinophagaceae bacterium]|nr:DinB family protein [Chitinophagaceae bacterium]